mgnify:FL=1
MGTYNTVARIHTERLPQAGDEGVVRENCRDAARLHRNRCYYQHNWSMAARYQAVFIRMVIQANHEARR